MPWVSGLGEHYRPRWDSAQESSVKACPEIVGTTMSLTSFELWTELGRLKLGTKDLFYFIFVLFYLFIFPQFCDVPEVAIVHKMI